MKPEDIKSVVREKYGEIATQSKLQNESSCCGATGCCSGVDYTIFSEKYDQLKGYNPDADLGLGCGIPTEFARIRQGDTVIDLGSGAGNDCFVARALVGETGQVIGIDMTQAMIDKARNNAEKLNFENVNFLLGDIEEMPIPENTADVVISNCVLNLVPDKRKAFSEIFRVLKSGGHFCVSDVVIKGELPEALRKDSEMYVGCVAGAVSMNNYLDIINDKGFKNITIHNQKVISIPDEVLENYLSKSEMEDFKNGDTGIFSITVSGYKQQ